MNSHAASIAIAIRFLASLLQPASEPSIEGAISSETLAPVYAALKQAPEGSTVHLHISSPGGEALSTLVFIDLAGHVKDERHLRVECDGGAMVASAAALIMESPVCDVRTVRPWTLFMVHMARIDAPPDAVITDEDRDELHSINDAMVNILAARLHRDPWQVESYLQRARWLTWFTLLRQGWVDHVVPLPPGP
jgi:ATP-dependent protease ClpP protease subunit